MIKLFATTNNRQALILGISARNIELLQLDMPIVVDLQALNPGRPVQDLILMAGPTEDAILEHLRAAMPGAWAAAERAGNVHLLSDGT